MLAFRIDEEHQSVVLLTQVFQENLCRFAVGLLHVIDEELLKVARYNPSRMLRQRQARDVLLGLLKGVEHGAIALQDAFAQVLADGFLLNKHLCGRDVSVYEVGVVHLHTLLVADELCDVLHTKDVLQKIGPEHLRLALLVSFAFPTLGELGGGCLYLLLCLHCIACFRYKDTKKNQKRSIRIIHIRGES